MVQLRQLQTPLPKHPCFNDYGERRKSPSPSCMVERGHSQGQKRMPCGKAQVPKSEILTDHALDPYCELCGEGVLEDAEHAFFHCPLFARERELAAGDNARITPDNIVATMLSSPFGWAAISKMASIIMKELRRRERSRREVNQPSD
ncbi:hypothetical protein ACLKA6_016454 [Drosophila palustris]